MHDRSLLAEAIEVARRAGFVIREEDLEGAGGGHCQLQGKKVLLLDLAQSVDDQLRDVVDALKNDGLAHGIAMSAALTSRVKPASRAA